MGDPLGLENYNKTVAEIAEAEAKAIKPKKAKKPVVEVVSEVATEEK